MTLQAYTRRYATSIAIVVGLLWSPAFAEKNGAPDTYEELMAWPTRPPIEFMFSVAIPQLPHIPHSDLRNKGRLDPATWSQIQERNADQFIAQLEYLFPGATWAFMGRDTEAHADLVEAFYLKLGQANRVVRIGISKPTFWDNDGAGNLFVTDEEIVQSFKSYGFSLNNLHESPPMILIDTLSRGSGRQGRVIIDAVYRSYARTGANPADLVHRFNMVGLATSTYQPRVQSLDRAKAALNNLAKTYRMQLTNMAERTSFSYFQHHPIVVIPHAPEHFHECGYEHFVGAWNDRFGKYALDSLGRLRAIFGQLNHPTIRANILWMQKQIINAVSNPNFLTRVISKAKQLGYNFPMSREPTPFVHAGYDLDELQQSLTERDQEVSTVTAFELTELAHALNQLPAHANAVMLSPAGRLIMDFLKQQQSRSSGPSPFHLAAHVLQITMAMHRTKVVTMSDFRAVLRELILLAPPSLTFMRLLIEALDSNPPLAMLVTKSKDWIKPDEANIAHLETIRYLLDEGRKGSNCENTFTSTINKARVL